MMLFLVVFLGIIIILVVVLTVVSFLISEGSFFLSFREEYSSYECGFEHHSLSRLPFSFRYFILTVVFLIFDMEVILLLFFPSALFYSSTSSIFLVCFFGFVTVLVIGLFYEWYDGSLEWII